MDSQPPPPHMNRCKSSRRQQASRQSGASASAPAADAAASAASCSACWASRSAGTAGMRGSARPTASTCGGSAASSRQVISFWHAGREWVVRPSGARHAQPRCTDLGERGGWRAARRRVRRLLGASQDDGGDGCMHDGARRSCGLRGRVSRSAEGDGARSSGRRHGPRARVCHATNSPGIARKSGTAISCFGALRAPMPAPPCHCRSLNPSRTIRAAGACSATCKR